MTSSATESPSPEYSKAAAVNEEQEHSSSLIIGAVTVVGFLVLAITGILLALKITRFLRARRERKRRRAVLSSGAREKRKGGWNAFDQQEWEGVPVNALRVVMSSCKIADRQISAQA